MPADFVSLGTARLLSGVLSEVTWDLGEKCNPVQYSALTEFWEKLWLKQDSMGIRTWERVSEVQRHVWFISYEENQVLLKTYLVDLLLDNKGTLHLNSNDIENASYLDGIFIKHHQKQHLTQSLAFLMRQALNCWRNRHTESICLVFWHIAEGMQLKAESFPLSGTTSLSLQSPSGTPFPSLDSVFNMTWWRRQNDRELFLKGILFDK